jgi:hypothetical protein
VYVVGSIWHLNRAISQEQEGFTDECQGYLKWGGVTEDHMHPGHHRPVFVYVWDARLSRRKT